MERVAAETQVEGSVSIGWASCRSQHQATDTNPSIRRRTQIPASALDRIQRCAPQHMIWHGMEWNGMACQGMLRSGRMATRSLFTEDLPGLPAAPWPPPCHLDGRCEALSAPERGHEREEEDKENRQWQGIESIGAEIGRASVKMGSTH